jgi:hypothetical protein
MEGHFMESKNKIIEETAVGHTKNLYLLGAE